MRRMTVYDPPDRGFEREIRKRIDYWARTHAGAGRRLEPSGGGGCRLRKGETSHFGRTPLATCLPGCYCRPHSQAEFS